MENTGIWVAVIIIVFVLGSILGLRVSPREKALGIMRHQGNRASARTEGLGFLAGVIFTMMVLAAVLLALRAGGTAVGWGFQLQSPLVISILALIILGAALNLLGVFEVGLSLQRAGEISLGRGAFVRSALTGALAIVAIGIVLRVVPAAPALPRRPGWSSFVEVLGNRQLLRLNAGVFVLHLMRQPLPLIGT